MNITQDIPGASAAARSAGTAARLPAAATAGTAARRHSVLYS